MKGWGNLSFRSVKRPNRAKRCIFSCEKVNKTFWFASYTYFKESAFTAVKKECKRLNKPM